MKGFGDHLQYSVFERTILVPVFRNVPRNGMAATREIDERAPHNSLESLWRDFDRVGCPPTRCRTASARLNG
jgi:hypothetical protein